MKQQVCYSCLNISSLSLDGEILNVIERNESILPELHPFPNAIKQTGVNEMLKIVMSVFRH